MLLEQLANSILSQLHNFLSESARKNYPGVQSCYRQQIELQERWAFPPVVPPTTSQWENYADTFSFVQWESELVYTMEEIRWWQEARKRCKNELVPLTVRCLGTWPESQGQREDSKNFQKDGRGDEVIYKYSRSPNGFRLLEAQWSNVLTILKTNNFPPATL